LNGEYAHEYDLTEKDYKEWERSFKLGFINCLLIYSSFMILGVILVSFIFNKIDSLLFNLILWGIIFPFTQLVLMWWVNKPEYIKYKSDNHS